VAANAAAEKHDIKRVKTIRLKLGQMAAAHPKQLAFGFETYAKGSRLEGARLEIEELPLVLKCDDCGMRFGDKRMDDHDFAHDIAHAPMTYLPPPCPSCKGESIRITQGQEMELVDIEGE
jgi:hydrogenase nickel incorporation protein HypA/HybF